MQIDVKVEGLDRIARESQAIKDAVAAELFKAMYASAKKVESDAKKSIQGGKKSGRTYKRSAIKRAVGGVIGSRIRWDEGKARRAGKIRERVTVGYEFHRASAPGEAPATDTGRLVNSIMLEGKHKVDGGVLSVGIVAGRGGVKYAKWLEFGTRGVVGHRVSFDGGKVSETGEMQRGVAARPFLFPALERNKQWIRERLAQAVRDAVARVAKKP